MIKNLFDTVHFSDAGVTERAKEEATYMIFLDLLYECEGIEWLLISIVLCAPQEQYNIVHDYCIIIILNVC